MARKHANKQHMQTYIKFTMVMWCVISVFKIALTALDLNTRETSPSTFSKIAVAGSRFSSWNMTAAWWFSSTLLSLYRSANGASDAIQKVLFKPGWSTS